MTALDTPYFRTVIDGPISQGPCTPGVDSNYWPFDLFALSSRLSILVSQIHPSWSVNLRTILSHNSNSMQVKVFFRDESQAIPDNIQLLPQDAEEALYGPYVTLEEPERQFYQSKIWYYTQGTPYIPSPDNERAGLRPCGLLAPWNPVFDGNGRAIPSYWLASILAHIPLTYEIPSYLVDNSINVVKELGNGNSLCKTYGQITDGMLQVYLAQRLYQDHYDALMFSVVNTIRKWYETGVIFCTLEFAKLWNLTLLEKDPLQIQNLRPKDVEKVLDRQRFVEAEPFDAVPEVQSVTDTKRYLENERDTALEPGTEGPRLYKAKWTHSAANPATLFLLARRDSKPFLFEIDDTKFHDIALYLSNKGLTFYFSIGLGVWFMPKSWEEFSTVYARLQELKYSDINITVQQEFSLHKSPQEINNGQVVYYTDNLSKPWCLSTQI